MSDIDDRHFSLVEIGAIAFLVLRELPDDEAIRRMPRYHTSDHDFYARYYRNLKAAMTAKTSIIDDRTGLEC